MLNLSIVLFIVAFGLHLFYDNMPYNLFDKFGGLIKKLTVVLPIAAVSLIIASGITTSYMKEVAASEQKTNYAAIEKQLADMRKDIADLRSDFEIAKTDSTYNERLNELESALSNAMESTESAIGDMQEDQDVMSKDITEVIEKLKEIDKENTKVSQPKATKAPKSKSSSKTTVYVPSGIYLRKSADSDSTILTTIPGGKSCTYLGEVSGWYHVSYKGMKGYVSRRLTEKR